MGFPNHLDSGALAEGIVLIVALVGLLVGLGISALIAWFLSTCLKRVPPEFRKQEPGMVWLLLIPCFNLVWNFFVHPKLAQSYQAYFASIGRTDVGDCGYGIALAYSIATVCCLVPILNYLAGLATLVLLIVWLIKASELKNAIPVDPSAALTPAR